MVTVQFLIAIKEKKALQDIDYPKKYQDFEAHCHI